MRQRALIAAVLACEPSLLVLDEPTTAARFLQGSSIQAWGADRSGNIGEEWMSAGMFLDLARSIGRAGFDYLLPEGSIHVGQNWQDSRVRVPAGADGGGLAHGGGHVPARHRAHALDLAYRPCLAARSSARWTRCRETEWVPGCWSSCPANARDGPIQEIEVAPTPRPRMLPENRRPRTAFRQQEELMRDIPEPMARRGGHPVLRMLASFPIACFTCALLTDLAYVQTTNVMWTDFSSWLLAAGMAGGVVAAIAGLVSWVAHRRERAQRPGWTFVLGSLLVLVVAFIDNLVHSRDAWTSVMPTGLALSFVTVLLMLGTAWLASSAGRRQGVAVPYSGARQ